MFRNLFDTFRHFRCFVMTQKIQGYYSAHHNEKTYELDMFEVTLCNAMYIPPSQNMPFRDVTYVLAAFNIKVLAIILVKLIKTVA